VHEAAARQPVELTRQPAAAAQRTLPVSIEQEELRGISRTVAEIHWLLLILVLLYLIFARPAAESEAAISAALFFYAAFVMGFRYANFFRSETRWKIAFETWAMIAVVTWVVWFTGKLESPLLNAYLLAVITSSLTLGKVTTLAEVALIAACYAYLAGGTSLEKLTSLAFFGALVAQLAPVILVAYITTMFSADIRFGLARAKLLSETDELTGLYNPRGFAIAANRLFAQTVRYDRPASVLMIDSDSLKSVNDNHGHEAGNRLLRQTANAIQAELRYTDVSARYGGDEFIVLLPETPAKGALDVAERIRSAIAGAALEVAGARVTTSVSVGIACFPDDGRTLDALATRADRALYKAKDLGRNRVERYSAG
jgi:diguanylate cyclase (GGDEF)-like protein